MTITVFKYLTARPTLRDVSHYSLDLPGLFANITQGCKCMVVQNALSDDTAVLVMTVKSFTVVSQDEHNGRGKFDR